MSGLFALLVLALAGCVDETGYEDTGDTRDLTTNPTGGTEADNAANGEGVYYSSASVLGAAPSDVTVLGLPGVIAPGTSATLSVVERPQAVPLVVTTNGFVGVVTAALGDTVQIRVGADVVHTLALTDDLSSVAAPMGSDSDGAAGGAGELPPAVSSGRVQVGDGSLPGLSAPYVAWIASRRAVAEVAAGDTEATLPAGAGDLLCAAPLGSGGATGTSICFTL